MRYIILIESCFRHSRCLVESGHRAESTTPQRLLTCLFDISRATGRLTHCPYSFLHLQTVPQVTRSHGAALHYTIMPVTAKVILSAYNPPYHWIKPTCACVCVHPSSIRASRSVTHVRPSLGPASLDDLPPAFRVHAGEEAVASLLHAPRRVVGPSLACEERGRGEEAGLCRGCWEGEGGLE